MIEDETEAWVGRQNRTHNDRQTAWTSAEETKTEDTAIEERETR